MSDSAVQKQKSNHIDDVTNNMRRRFALSKKITSTCFWILTFFSCEDIEKFPKSAFCAFCAIQVPLSPPPSSRILPRLIRGNDKAALSKCGQGKCKAVYTINECVSHVHQQIPGGKSTYTMHF